MSRTKHTDPRSIRANRRTVAPRGKRSDDDPSLRRRLGLWAKETGGKSSDQAARRPGLGTPVPPRIIEQRPRRGFHHPAGRDDLLRVFERLGPDATYGVRSIELCQSLEATQGELPRFASLCVPGRIKLYELPLSPWRLRGVIAERDASLLANEGALVTVYEDLDVTLIHWPGNTLRRFMLFDVLLHEIGHHILQHNKGKRLARIARTRDHEAYAARFAAKCRGLCADLICAL